MNTNTDELDLNTLDQIQGGNPLSYEENKKKAEEALQVILDNELSAEELEKYLAGLDSEVRKAMQEEIQTKQLESESKTM